MASVASCSRFRRTWNGMLDATSACGGAAEGERAGAGGGGTDAGRGGGGAGGGGTDAGRGGGGCAGPVSVPDPGATAAERSHALGRFDGDTGALDGRGGTERAGGGSSGAFFTS